MSTGKTTKGKEKVAPHPLYIPPLKKAGQFPARPGQLIQMNSFRRRFGLNPSGKSCGQLVAAVFSFHFGVILSVQISKIFVFVRIVARTAFAKLVTTAIGSPVRSRDGF